MCAIELCTTCDRPADVCCRDGCLADRQRLDEQKKMKERDRDREKKFSKQVSKSLGTSDLNASQS